MNIRPATEADLVGFFGQKPAELQITRIRAWSAVEGEKVLGIGGVRFHADGGVTGFLNAGAELRSHPVVLHRATLRFLKEWRAMGFRTLRATIDCRIPRAPEWARRLGFEPMDEDGGVWAWRA